MSATLRVGLPAPEFDLPCVGPKPGVRGRAVLAERRGRWLALLFYPRDFSMVCPTELIAMSTRRRAFGGYDCDILGVSVDDPDTHERWLRTPTAEGGVAGVAFPLASDGDGRVARDYGVLIEETGVALRGLFLIDPDGVLQYSVVQNLGVGRGTDEVLRVLAALRSGGVCAADWSTQRSSGATSLLAPGKILSHYRLEEALGRGDFASVFRARDLKLDRSVALKVVDPGSRQSASSILAEARAAASLNHPNVAVVYAVDDSEGIPLIAMELVDGVTLRARLIESALPCGEALRIAACLASAMTAAHERGVVHGDLKPENVMLTPDGTPKILDFGLSHREDRAARTTETDLTLSGTPRYLAPELFHGGRPTQATDVYALGAVLFEMLTGTPLLPQSDIAALVRAVISGSYIDQLSALPDDLRPLLASALARDPEQRTLRMREFSARLSA